MGNGLPVPRLPCGNATGRKPKKQRQCSVGMGVVTWVSLHGSIDGSNGTKIMALGRHVTGVTVLYADH